MKISALLAKARSTFESGDYDSTVAYAESVMEKDPLNVEARIILAEVALDEADFERAWAIAEDTLAIEEGNPIVQILAAEAALMLEELETVVQLIEPFLRRDPGHFKARHIMAEALLDLGQPVDAGKLFETLVEEDEDFPDGWLGLAISHFEKGQWQLSLGSLKEVKRLVPDQADVFHIEALNHEYLGDQRGAQRAHKKAQTLDSDRFPAPIALSLSAFKDVLEEAILGLPDTARAWLAEATVTVKGRPTEEEIKDADSDIGPRSWGQIRGDASPPEVTLYRDPLQRGVRDAGELTQEIRVTLLHEVGSVLGEEG